MNTTLTHFWSPAQSHTERVSGDIFGLASSFKMQLLCYIAVTLLCGLSLSLSEATISCKDNQYLWPLEKPRVCCNKCPPGTRLDRPNSNSTCSHTCKKCDGDMYQQTYNLDLTCNICENCRRTNMEYLSLCNATHNAVCKCKAGYECRAEPCVQCRPIPSTTTITATLTPITLTSTVVAPVKASTTISLQRDSLWYPIVIALLSAGIAIIAVVFVINNKTLLRRSTSSVKNSSPWSELCPAVPMRCVDEEISKPVQEAGSDCILKTELELELLEMSQSPV